MLILGVGGFRPPMDTTLRSIRRLGVDIELLFNWPANYKFSA